MPTGDLVLAMFGSGGDGVITMGDMMAQAGARDGLNVMKVEAYGPQIRGGESSCQVRLSAGPIFTQGDKVEVMVVFNWNDYLCFKGELEVADDAVILYEASDTKPLDEVGITLGEKGRWIPVDFIKLAKDAAGTTLAKNIVTLGVLCAAFNIPRKWVEAAIDHKFSKKKAAVLEANIKGFNAGLEWGATISEKVEDMALEYTPTEPKLLMSGNEASAVGALHAGCRFFAGYPITPSSEILHFLSEWMPRMGGSLVQTEDELSAMGAVIGGSFAGVKSMTATSGPGLALMTEMLGLASMAEVPAVIVDVQRGGPSTGLPTKSEQSDLWQALWGSHGDAPRVVLAPADVEDCFHATVEAFNIAEESQMPVIVLSDQFIAQRRETMSMLTLNHEVHDRLEPTEEELADGNYLRYRDTENGISPMSAPGMKGGEYQTNGLEHLENGRPTSMHVVHEKMNRKRYRKLRQVRNQYCFHRRYGSERADVGILCWGSSKGPVKEAVMKAVERGDKVSAFVPQVLYPFPRYEFEEYLKTVKNVIVVELSFSAQFYKYLKTFLKLPENTFVFKRSGGRNLTVSEIESRIDKAIQMGKLRREVMV